MACFDGYKHVYATFQGHVTNHVPYIPLALARALYCHMYHSPLYTQCMTCFIDSECYSRGNFIYQKRPFNPRSVRVTALHLISQIRSLCVGYSFGGFHIYGLSPLMLICSAPLMLHAPSVPVTHFAYMEPENDPRSFVYLWVARGRSPAVEQRYACICYLHNILC